MKNAYLSIKITKFKRIFFVICLIISLNALPAVALTQVEINPINTPNGAVILIIDGLGSSYIYPEITPYSLDGTIIEKPSVQNIHKLSNNGLKAVEIVTPTTEGETGHSVIVTGNSEASPAMITQTDATIYDIVRKNGFLSFAILQKGDIPEMLAEQDVVVHDATTSINDPQMQIIANSQHHSGYEDLQTSVTEIIKKMQTKHPFT